MGYLCFLFILFQAAVSQGAPERIPNIEFIANGYDLYYGNSFPSDGLSDPGSRQKIFLLQYTQNKTYGDRFFIPDGVDFDYALACSMQWESSNVSGTHSYYELLQTSYSADFSGFGGAFSASYSYKYVSNMTDAEQHVFNTESLQCQTYVAELETFSLPDFSDNFKNGVQQLPLTYNNNTEKDYFQFIEAFGTHWITNVNMGARYSWRFEFDSYQYWRMKQEIQDFDLAASYAGMYKAGVTFSSHEEQQQAETFINRSVFQDQESIGVLLPSSFSRDDWIDNITVSPSPIHYSLSPIYKLLDSKNFPKDIFISKRAENLARALQDYCLMLVATGVISACLPPGPDPPVVSPVFGGIYSPQQNTDPGWPSIDIVNPFTGDLNCPQDYSSYMILDVYICVYLGGPVYARCQIRAFLCLKGLNDTSGYFGGMYQSFAGHPEPEIANPLTGTVACANGTIPFPGIGAILGYRSTICFQPTLSQASPFGGSFITGSGAEGVTTEVNPYTNAFSCPLGYNLFSYTFPTSGGYNCGDPSFGWTQVWGLCMK